MRTDDPTLSGITLRRLYSAGAMPGVWLLMLITVSGCAGVKCVKPLDRAATAGVRRVSISTNVYIPRLLNIPPEDAPEKDLNWVDTLLSPPAYEDRTYRYNSYVRPHVRFDEVLVAAFRDELDRETDFEIVESGAGADAEFVLSVSLIGFTDTLVSLYTRSVPQVRAHAVLISDPPYKLVKPEEWWKSDARMIPADLSKNPVLWEAVSYRTGNQVGTASYRFKTYVRDHPEAVRDGFERLALLIAMDMVKTLPESERDTSREKKKNAKIDWLE